ncbi:DUF2630 family protein [Streptomyces chryseus]|uniref:DUF2630 family protein n=1 Tax=Streptomyces chryseus TaxID=68186 RepID=A0ABQ3DZB2_9ACTN|nr:DUF2630 family protein [Streptomyces chryseus]GHB16160.1 hypothetical protein GCM10010346_44880 [Streptomyces chryseus]
MADTEDANQEILDNITGLVGEERELRERSTRKLGLDNAERARLRSVEIQLDQCWDLLRQRRAKSEFGEDPGKARVRPASEVENYKS